LAFEQLKSLFSFGLVGKLLGQGSDDVVKTVHHGLLEFFEVAAVRLAVELVLDLLDPLGELVAEVVEVSFNVGQAVIDLSNHTIINLASICRGNVVGSV
jgi:hypothetical protein